MFAAWEHVPFENQSLINKPNVLHHKSKSSFHWTWVQTSSIQQAQTCVWIKRKCMCVCCHRCVNVFYVWDTRNAVWFPLIQISFKKAVRSECSIRIYQIPRFSGWWTWNHLWLYCRLHQKQIFKEPSIFEVYWSRSSLILLMLNIEIFT